MHRHDIASILAKKRQKLDSLEVEVYGERSENPSRVWTKLEILYKLRGVLEETAVQHAVQLSQESIVRLQLCFAKPQ